MEHSEPQGEEEGERRDLGDLWREFWAETKAFRKYFSWNAFIEAVLLKFFLPLNDIISDFLIAEKFHNTRGSVKKRNEKKWQGPALGVRS